MTRVPPPGASVIVMVPWWAVAISFAIARPSWKVCGDTADAAASWALDGFVVVALGEAVDAFDGVPERSVDLLPFGAAAGARPWVADLAGQLVGNSGIDAVSPGLFIDLGGIVVGSFEVLAGVDQWPGHVGAVPGAFDRDPAIGLSFKTKIVLGVPIGWLVTEGAKW